MYSYLFWIFTKTSIYEISTKTEKLTKLGEILYQTLPQECNFLMLFTKKNHKFVQNLQDIGKDITLYTLPYEILVKFVTSYVMKFVLVIFGFSTKKYTRKPKVKFHPNSITAHPLSS
jgi:hypothetical protein